jgi:ABC-2 type transport system permease protein
VNRTIFAVTLRELTGQRRSLLLVLLAAVPIALAIIYQFGDRADPQDWAANVLLHGVVVTLVLPLTCLVIGTSALGTEIDDGTVVYLLTKPISRTSIVTAKFAAAGLVSATLVVVATAISGAIGVAGAPSHGLVPAFTIAVGLAALGYTALFVLLSVVTSRALLVGLAYVFVWEGVLTNLFSATAYLSIREYCLAIADAITTLSPDVFSSQIGAGYAFPLLAAVTVSALYVAVRRLQTLELSESE